MKARRPGLCPICDEQYPAGTEIGPLDVPREFEGKGRVNIYTYKWAHAKCAAEANAAYRKRISAIGEDDDTQD